MTTAPSRLFAVLVTAALLLAACGGDPTPTPSPSPSPSPLPSPSPSPSPTPTTAAPLSGVPADEETLARPALVVKVENTARARPQAGLEQADLVVEELVEGGITRFVAVFQSTVPEQVGPVRSARPVDATLLPAFGRGIFLFSGGRDEVVAGLRATGVPLLTEGDPGVYRQPGRSAPSNLFADGAAVYETGDARSDDLGPPPPWFTFDGAVPDGGATGRAIDISMSSQTTTSWAYSESDGGYLRSQNGAAQTTVSEDPVVASNVVVLGVEIFDEGCCDTAGSPYVGIRTTGEGRAIVLRDGQWFEATWSRPDPSAPVELTRDGVALPLRPGPTWLHLAPRDRLPEAPSTAATPAPSTSDGDG